jgi:cell division protein FtsI/penicillin-binding protein 2
MPKATGSGDPHAWFIGFIGLPGEDPRYAVAIVLEAGGGGGQVALPIAATSLSRRWADRRRCLFLGNAL